MPVYHQTTESACVLFLEDNVDLASPERMHPYLVEIKQNDAIKSVIINFEKIDFIDSSGIAVVVKLFKDLQNHGVRMVLCQMEKHVFELFCLTGFDRHIKVYANEADARKALEE
ncbi:MAG: STAS domain-containing protein [SAR324 cluster bacterium]|nr:STAS domain-containing protein [SAR324 cluster bacterium]